MSKGLFSNDIEPSCKHCANGRLSKNGDFILCKHRGVIAPDSKCKKFHYDPLKRSPSRLKMNADFTSEDFTL